MLLSSPCNLYQPDNPALERDKQKKKQKNLTAEFGQSKIINNTYDYQTISYKS